MLSKLISWVKNNKLTTALIVIVVFLLAPRNFSPLSSLKRSDRFSDSMNMLSVGSMGMETSYEMMPETGGGSRVAPVPSEYPINPTQNRKVITESYFSLLVKNVTDVVTKVTSEVEKMGGYLVTTNISRPEQGEDASVTLRVPTEKVEQLQAFLRDNSVKVVSENISGRDITDQYSDIQSRIDTLESMRRRIQTILDTATTVEEMLKVQNQLFSIQNQIDSLKGQLLYMDGASSTSLISVHFSTDELSLPYAPTNAWRPQLIFKEAVRSLLGTLQSLGATAIWLAVYSVILIPAGLIAWIIWRAIKKKTF